jgi:hypothetical protein
MRTVDPDIDVATWNIVGSLELLPLLTSEDARISFLSRKH